MSGMPCECVVDTNVATTANGANSEAGAECVAKSAKALHVVMKQGRVFIDSGGRIVEEYRRNLNAKGQPGPGDAFVRWILTNEWGETRVTRVPVTPKAEDPTDFDELPTPCDVKYDASDRKFLAVAAAHPDHPPILQSFDSKWWGWRDALEEAGLKVHFLCEEAIEKKYLATIRATIRDSHPLFN